MTLKIHQQQQQQHRQTNKSDISISLSFSLPQRIVNSLSDDDANFEKWTLHTHTHIHIFCCCWWWWWVLRWSEMRRKLIFYDIISSTNEALWSLDCLSFKFISSLLLAHSLTLTKYFAASRHIHTCIFSMMMYGYKPEKPIPFRLFSIFEFLTC